MIVLWRRDLGKCECSISVHCKREALHSITSVVALSKYIISLYLLMFMYYTSLWVYTIFL